MVKTKIIATLGPASSSETVLRKMFIKGLDIVRLNFSHGTHMGHMMRIEAIRRLNKKMRRAIKIMQDLEGYRIRIGKLSKPVLLEKGDRFYLTQQDITGTKKEIPFSYKGSLRKIKENSLLYVDDGKIVLNIKKVENGKLYVKTIMPGILKKHKGINFPGVRFDFEALTVKDTKDVEIAIGQKLDYVAQSFVRNAEDIEMLRNIVNKRHKKCKIFAKVENKDAISNIEEIIDASDGIIVARGDLGISVPIYTVPIIQKMIISRCRLKNKPVVVATQMLEGMTEELIPTRAEVSDVANAILDRATHLMLSGETAVGRHPHKAVEMMNKIIKYTESYQSKQINLDSSSLV